MELIHNLINFKFMKKYFVYIFIMFLVGCSMNSNSINVISSDKVSNVEFKINKKIGVNIND